MQRAIDVSLKNAGNIAYSSWIPPKLNCFRYRYVQRYTISIDFTERYEVISRMFKGNATS